MATTTTKLPDMRDGSGMGVGVRLGATCRNSDDGRRAQGAGYAKSEAARQAISRDE